MYVIIRVIRYDWSALGFSFYIFFFFSFTIEEVELCVFNNVAYFNTFVQFDGEAASLPIERVFLCSPHAALSVLLIENRYCCADKDIFRIFQVIMYWSALVYVVKAISLIEGLMYIVLIVRQKVGAWLICLICMLISVVIITRATVIMIVMVMVVVMVYI